MGSERESGATAMLLAGPLGTSLDEYAQGWLEGHSVEGTGVAERPGATGRHWRFSTPDGREQHALLLLSEAGRVYGLHVRATAEAWARSSDTIEEMIDSLRLERPETYPREADADWGFSLGVPDSWRSTRRLASGRKYLRQFQSPALGADRESGTVHAFLSLTVEPLPGDGSVGAFYEATLARLGEAQRVLWHQPWRGGFADVARAETQLSSSRMKRFYLVAGTRGYCLSCEAREDVFHRVTGWCDLIASTLEVQASS